MAQGHVEGVTVKSRLTRVKYIYYYKRCLLCYCKTEPKQTFYWHCCCCIQYLLQKLFNLLKRCIVLLKCTQSNQISDSVSVISTRNALDRGASGGRREHKECCSASQAFSDCGRRMGSGRTQLWLLAFLALLSQSDVSSL